MELDTREPRVTHEDGDLVHRALGACPPRRSVLRRARRGVTIALVGLV